MLVPKNEKSSSSRSPSPQQPASSSAASVQRKTLRGMDYASQLAALDPVQMEGGGGQSPEAVHAAAAQGVAGGGGALPHSERIQQAFGRHDVGAVQAHVGGAAKNATAAMGAEAYATGDKVAFGSAPSLHTAAHEAAHIVQQRAGVSLAGGVGAAGDSYEQHADSVADAVVSGQSAEGLLDSYGGGGSSGGSVQQKKGRTPKPADEGKGAVGADKKPDAKPAATDATKADPKRTAIDAAANITDLGSVNAWLDDAGSAALSGDVDMNTMAASLELLISFSGNVKAKQAEADKALEELQHALQEKKKEALMDSLIELAITLPVGILALKEGIHLLRKGIKNAAEMEKLISASKEVGENVNNAREVAGAGGGGFDDQVVANIKLLNDRVSAVEQATLTLIGINFSSALGQMRISLFDTVPNKLRSVSEAIRHAAPYGAYNQAALSALDSRVAGVEGKLGGFEMRAKALEILAQGYKTTGKGGDLAQTLEGGETNGARGFFDMLTQIKLKGNAKMLKANINRDVSFEGADNWGSIVPHTKVRAHKCDYILKGFQEAAAASGIDAGKVAWPLNFDSLKRGHGGEGICLDEKVGRTLLMFAEGGIDWSTTYGGKKTNDYCGMEFVWNPTFQNLVGVSDGKMHLIDQIKNRGVWVDVNRATMELYPSTGTKIDSLVPDMPVL